MEDALAYFKVQVPKAPGWARDHKAEVYLWEGAAFICTSATTNDDRSEGSRPLMASQAADQGRLRAICSLDVALWLCNFLFTMIVVQGQVPI